MGKKNDIQQLLTSMVAAAGIVGSVSATAKVDPTSVPRGADIAPIAGACTIGKFPQTMKVGHYNALCHTMQDAEKCLAFIKGHFASDGDTTKTGEPAKMEYCLGELSRVLGADPL